MQTDLVTLPQGAHAKIITPRSRLVSLHCIQGQTRIFTRPCSVGWSLGPGEHFVMRSGTTYELLASSATKLAVNDDA